MKYQSCEKCCKVSSRVFFAVQTMFCLAERFIRLNRKQTLTVRKSIFDLLLYDGLLLVIETHGRNPKDDIKLRPIICLIEGAIHNILLNYDDAQNVSLNLCLIRRLSFSLLHLHSATKKRWLEQKIQNWLSLVTSHHSRHANLGSLNIFLAK